MDIKILSKKTLSQWKYLLQKVAYQYTDRHNQIKKAEREVYNRGDGAALLLYNKERQSVILIRQVRLPVYLNRIEDKMLIEVCAGTLDNDDPETCVRRESEEETGYRVSEVKKVFEAYMSPGAVTEKIHCFIGAYSSESKVSDGGGLEAEHEEIEVFEISFLTAYEMIGSGEIKDAKTIMLLQYAFINRIFEAK